MKRSFLLFVALALLLLTAALAPVFKSDPGHVLITFMDWTIETSVLVLAVAVILLWIGFQLLIRLWRLPAETARRVREQRSIAQLEKGLLALTEGDWRTAEKALGKSTSTRGKTTARYLAAAQAADGQDANERRDYYLEQADSGGTRKKFLIELTRARMLVANEAREQALPILEELHERFETNADPVRAAMAEVEQLGSIELAQQLPDISAPWSQLRLLREGRALSTIDQLPQQATVEPDSEAGGAR